MINSMEKLKRVQTGDIIQDATGYYFKLHGDGRWRYSSKIGEDQPNVSPVNADELKFPMAYVNDYTLEERLQMLTLRVEALENK